MSQMLYDISPRLRPAIAVWPGDSPLHREVLTDLHHGANLTLSTLHATVHLGAHADAPSHTDVGGSDIASQPLDVYVGRCQVITVDVSRAERVIPRHVAHVRSFEERVLFRTRTFPDPERWNTDFASLSPELVAMLASHGVRLVGIDTPSIDLFDSKDLPTHAACVAHDIRNLEGIVLDGVGDGLFELIALPLALVGFDASPVRAVLRTLT